MENYSIKSDKYDIRYLSGVICIAVGCHETLWILFFVCIAQFASPHATVKLRAYVN